MSSGEWLSRIAKGATAIGKTLLEAQSMPVPQPLVNRILAAKVQHLALITELKVQVHEGYFEIRARGLGTYASVNLAFESVDVSEAGGELHLRTISGLKIESEGLLGSVMWPVIEAILSSPPMIELGAAVLACRGIQLNGDRMVVQLSDLPLGRSRLRVNGEKVNGPLYSVSDIECHFGFFLVSVGGSLLDVAQRYLGRLEESRSR